jgi:hypothetical protein
MVNYKKLYLRLFNAITDAIEILKKAQIEAEEAYMDADDEIDESKLKKFKVHCNDKNENN